VVTPLYLVNTTGPGVYVEEISGGPRPIAASPTTDTAFLAVLSLPSGFHVGGEGGTFRSLIPAVTSADAAASWARELAFRSVVPKLGAPPTLLLEGKAISGADLIGKLGTVDVKKKESFRLGGKDFADAKKLVVEIEKSPSGALSIEKVKGDAAAPHLQVQVKRAEDVPPTLAELAVETLGAGWKASGSASGDQVRVLLEGSRTFDVLLPQSMLVSGKNGWVLAKPSMRDKVLATIGAEAVAQGIGTSTTFDGDENDVNEDVLLRVQEALVGTVAPLTSLDAFLAWREEFGDALYVELASIFTKSPKGSVSAAWRSPDAGGLRAAWLSWLKTNPGMLRLEVSLRGFFGNGGSTAYPGVCLSAGGVSAMSKSGYLSNAYDDFSRVAMVCAPGLGKDWQQAILEYCGPKGRGDLFAVLDTPRYLLTQPTTQADRDRVGSLRWSDKFVAGDDPNFEIQSLQAIGSPEVSELRFRKMEDTLLSECVPRDDVGHGAAYGPWVVADNPNTTGLSDRYVIAPPSGFVAGLIAATDDKAGGGVHKAPANEQLGAVSGLVALVSDRDQGPLNTRGLNIIRPRPNAGIRVWGARTVASDPLWRYINVRRLFLMVERSVREAVQWAVFLPNTDTTRGDLRSSIAGFLYSLYREGMLDGATPDEAYNVQCDRENNPDVDVRSGILTVDVELRPPYPAEFIRLRFRQAPMQVEA
jgi:phage tail sheath protein FI